MDGRSSVVRPSSVVARILKPENTMKSILVRGSTRWGEDPRALYTLRESRRGGDELRTSVYPSNFAPIATKLRQRAFQMICKFRFFDAEKFFSQKKIGSFSIFHRFRQILEDLGIFGCQNQIPRRILLQGVNFSGS